MTLLIQIHIAFALAAVALGLTNLLRQKGTISHVALGYIYVISLLIVSIGSFWINAINQFYGLSVIHLLSAWTILCMVIAVIMARRGRIEQHKYWMIGTYCGLLGAGLGTLFPGRLIPTLLFSG